MSTVIQRAPYVGWRALAATVLVTAGAVGAHSWAGGHVPDGSVLIALAALVYAASLLVLRGAVSALVLLPALAVAQGGLHASFVGSAAAHGGHVGHEVAASSWTWQMLASHVAVTALTGLVWRLCARAAICVVTALDLVPHLIAPRLAARPTATARHALTTLELLVAAPRRGPPVVAGRI